MFMVQFMVEGFCNGEKCMYIIMYEIEDEFVNDMLSFDFGFEMFASFEGFCFINFVSLKGKYIFNQFLQIGGLLSVQSFIDKIVVFVNFWQVDCFVIDLMMLFWLFFVNGFEEMMWFLMVFKQGDVMMFFIFEMMDFLLYFDEYFFVYGVVFFYNYLEVMGMICGIQVIKMCGMNIDCDIWLFEFIDNGLVVDFWLKVDF